MKKILQLTTMISVAVTTMFMSSCDTPTPKRTTPTYTTTYQQKPRVTIQNNSYRNIVVGVEGPEKRFVSVPARTSRTVYLRSGVYKYAAAARNTRTISGYKAFSANRSYTWKFGVN
ncbi:hypothetical protein NT6N_12440 [Oceaniferula spumae]|uniref:Uncharacterized protein n=1 Tax=Oceaniferula spumae TaxID=2979115 RepID=A0AAT9FJN0_9BACT